MWSLVKAGGMLMDSKKASMQSSIHSSRCSEAANAELGALKAQLTVAQQVMSI